MIFFILIIIIFFLASLTFALKNLWHRYRNLRETLALYSRDTKFPRLAISKHKTNSVVVLPVYPLGDTLSLSILLYELKTRLQAEIYVPLSLVSNPLWEFMLRVKHIDSGELPDTIDLLIGPSRYPDKPYVEMFKKLSARYKVFVLWNYSFLPLQYVDRTIYLPMPAGINFHRGMLLLTYFITGSRSDNPKLRGPLLEALNDISNHIYNLYLKGSKYILFHLHASEGRREFPRKYTERLFHIINERLPFSKDYKLVLVGTSDDRKRMPVNLYLDNIVDLRGKLKIEESISLALKADLVIASDSIFRTVAELLEKPLITWSTDWAKPSNFWPLDRPKSWHIHVKPLASDDLYLSRLEEDLVYTITESIEEWYYTENTL